VSEAGRWTAESPAAFEGGGKFSSRDASARRIDGLVRYCQARPNVRAKPTVEADAGWPRKDDTNFGLERPDGGCRSGSAP